MSPGLALVVVGLAVAVLVNYALGLLLVVLGAVLLVAGGRV